MSNYVLIPKHLLNDLYFFLKKIFLFFCHSIMQIRNCKYNIAVCIAVYNWNNIHARMFYLYIYLCAFCIFTVDVESIYSIFSFKYENNIMGLLSWSCACTYKSAEEQSFVFEIEPHLPLIPLNILTYMRKCHIL